MSSLKELNKYRDKELKTKRTTARDLNIKGEIMRPEIGSLKFKRDISSPRREPYQVYVNVVNNPKNPSSG